MELIKYILEIILDIYQLFCTIVVSLLILLYFIGKRQLKKIDKRIFQNSENKTIN